MADVTERRKRIIWDWIDEHHPDWWDRPEMLSNPRVIQRLVLLTKATAKNGSAAKAEDVERWLRDAATESPFVDEVAVRRAVALEYEVFSSLTRKERGEAVGRLAAMDDPFDLESEDRDNEGVVRSASHRRLAYLAWPPVEQRRLRDTVKRRRARLRAPLEGLQAAA